MSMPAKPVPKKSARPGARRTEENGQNQNQNQNQSQIKARAENTLVLVLVGTVLQDPAPLQQLGRRRGSDRRLLDNSGSYHERVQVVLSLVGLPARGPQVLRQLLKRGERDFGYIGSGAVGRDRVGELRRQMSGCNGCSDGGENHGCGSDHHTGPGLRER